MKAHFSEDSKRASAIRQIGYGRQMVSRTVGLPRLRVVMILMVLPLVGFELSALATQSSHATLGWQANEQLVASASSGSTATLTVRVASSAQSSLIWLNERVGVDSLVQSELDRKTASIVHGLMRGRTTELASLLRTPDKLIDVVRFFELFEAAYGAITDYAVFETVRLANGTHQTYVVITFGEVDQRFRFSWRGERLNTIGRSTRSVLSSSCVVHDSAMMRCDAPLIVR